MRQLRICQHKCHCLSEVRQEVLRSASSYTRHNRVAGDLCCRFVPDIFVTLKKSHFTFQRYAIMRYPAACTAQRVRFVITFRDMPEETTEAGDAGEALSKAGNMLRTTMSEYFNSGRVIPMPSAQQQGECLVGLPLSISANFMC
jgi:hypothetical protein